MTTPDESRADETPPSPERTPLWISQRAAGRTMVGVAVFGLVLSIVGTVVAYQLVGQLGRSSDQSLALGQEALVSLDATLVLADGFLDAVDGGLGGVSATLEAVAGTVEGTTAVAGATAELADEIVPSLERVDEGLGSLESAAGTVDTVLRQLSQIPFGPSYDPETSFDQALGDVRQDLAPIAESLRRTSEDLARFADGSEDLEGELLALRAEVETVRSSLTGSGALIQDYRRTAAEAARLADRTRGDLGDDLGRSRIVIVLMGISVAVGQIVPAWLGRTLLMGPGPVA